MTKAKINPYYSDERKPLRIQFTSDKLTSLTPSRPLYPTSITTRWSPSPSPDTIPHRVGRAVADVLREVAALAYSATTGTVYTAGADGHVCELDADSGTVQAKWKAGKTPLTALAASADGDRLLAAGASLSLWDLASHERMGKMSGHAVPAHLLAFSPDASRAVSAAPGEPAVVLWDGAGGGGTPGKGGGTPGKGARAGALATLSMDHPPAQLTTHAAGGKKHFGVLAVCEVRPPPPLCPSAFCLAPFLYVREEGHSLANVWSPQLSAAAGASARNLRIGNEENDFYLEPRDATQFLGGSSAHNPMTGL